MSHFTRIAANLFPFRGALLFFLLILPLNAQGARTVTVAAVGDIMMGSDFPTPKLPPRDGRDLFAAVAPYLRRADIALGNLEGPLCSEETPAKEPLAGRRYLFRTPPSYAKNLKEAGFSILSLANNHARDFGGAGLESTRKALSGAGVQFSSKKGEIARFDLHGVRVAVIALAYGPPPRSIVFPAQPLQEIERAASEYDVVILSIHAGAEGRGALHVAPGEERFLEESRGDLVRFAHDAIARGADLVLAHGPHVPRALELYRGRLIAYSLGNFATYGGVSVVGESGLAPLLTVELAADGSFIGGNIDSFRQFRYTGPQPDPKRRALRLMRRLSAEDFPDSPLVFGDGGRIGVKQPVRP
ncbi:CapA family protein [Geomonas subterranea]|uniref:CapA family protein n=1 Tax=Geomonas subterranea TaxID=2847989 RepID=A0ABX8LPX3_9BACT|nr:CapA family protein [Geomonas subterranea]QXM11594.1 CapA family protein [Geomonas subterranea]